MNLPFWIGLRYTRARRRNHFISFISLASAAGIVLGVWALITVMSVMNGFHKDLRERILFVVSHVTISERGGDGVGGWEEVARQVGAGGEVAAVAPFVLGQGMVSKGGQASGVLVRGVFPEAERGVSEVLGHVVEGSGELRGGEFGIVLGATLARGLGVRVGERVTLISPKGRVTPAGILPRLKRFKVVGVFRIDMHEYDSGIALVHIEDAVRVFGAGGGDVGGLSGGVGVGALGGVGGLRLRLVDVERAPLVRRALQAELGEGYAVRDWTMEHANFFRALQIEKRVVFIVLLLIVAVAAFNLVSTLVMVVTDKRADVAVLRTLGLSPGGVMGIFVVQGAAIGVVGTAVGGALGVVTALNVDVIIPAVEGFFRTELFPVDVYLITDFPAEMRWGDVGRVVGVALGMSFLATVYPAWRAARVRPAEVLRYE